MRCENDGPPMDRLKEPPLGNLLLEHLRSLLRNAASARMAFVAVVLVLLVPHDSVAEDVFLFPYFQSNGETGVYLSWSNDGREFLELNHGNPIFTPPQWPDGQSLTRDPSILFHDGLFHMVWTSNWTGRIFGYANSPDLVTWSTPLKITPFSPSLPDDSQPDNIWAPEIHFDPVRNNFQILFSSTIPSEEYDGDGSEDSHGNDHRIYSIRTTNFQSFTSPVVTFDQNFSVIDGHMVFDDRGTTETTDDRWIMSVKWEQDAAVGGKNIRLTFNDPQQSNAWSPVTDPPIIGPGSSIRPNELAEGPSMVRYGGQWLLYWDAYSSGHYGMASSTDLVHWTDETANLSFPTAHPRHGTVFLADRSLVGWRTGPRSDLNEDGDVNALDWSIFRSYHLTDLSGLSPLEQDLRGDLDGDGDNDFFDFRLFQSDYDLVHGEGAFGSLLDAQVPEPGSSAILALCILGSAICRLLL